jgi:hypothetical protein
MMMITSILRKVGLAAIMFLVFSCLKVGAQGYDMSDAQGNQNNTDYNRTGEGVQAMPVNLGANAVVPAGYTPLNQIFQPSNIAQAITGTQNTLAGKYGQTGRNGLPVCNMDSFVYQAMITGQADQIYGDEGTDSIPPLDNFSYINSGIGADSSGLTTGHGSMMPSAWGADEFLAPPGEWSMSGAQ